MVHISGAKLRPESIAQVNSLLYKIIGTSRSEKEFQALFTEIFSKKEQILIAKRVVIMYLLIKEIPQRDIAHALRVSIATVTKYSTFLKDRETPLTKTMTKQLKNEAVMNLLEDIFFNILVQPGIKRGHWAQYWGHEKTKQRQKTSGI